MNRKQIQDFLYRISGWHYKVNYYYSKTFKYGLMFVNAFDNSTININRLMTKYLEENVFKSGLMHEVGHHKTAWSNNASIREYRAQIWAINKAKRLKMNNVKKEAMDSLRGWKDAKNIKRARMYYNAYRMAKKNKII